MPLLISTAGLLSNNTLERGVIETVIDRDDMFAMLPFTRVNSKAYYYNREDPAGMSGAAFVAANGTVAESPQNVTQQFATLSILIGDVDVDKFLSGTMDDTNNQAAIQIAAKAKAVARLFHQTVASGDTTVDPNSFMGIQKLVDAGQTFATGGAVTSVTLSMMDQLKDQVILGADAFVMRRGTWRAIKQAMRAMGGTRADMVQIPNFGQPVPAFDGIPVLMNDFLSQTETVTGAQGGTACSIYAARFNEADGLHGIYGGDNAGMVVEDIGTVTASSQALGKPWIASPLRGPSG